jgi:hypothetical protein
MNKLKESTDLRKRDLFFQVLVYVLPVVLVSLLVNVPRWLELELTELSMPDQVTICDQTPGRGSLAALARSPKRG